MIYTDAKTFIQTLIAELAGIKCIWDYQNAPKPANPYISLRLSPERDTGTETRGRSDGTGIVDVIQQKETTLSINAFGTGALEICNMLWQKLQRPTIVDRCFTAKIAFIRSEQPQDLTALLDGRSWEQRANVDLIVTYSRAITDEPGYITTVEAIGTIGEPDTPTPIVDTAIVDVTINMKGVQ